jgi:hypothetical protein
MCVMDSGYSGTPQLKKLGIAAGSRLDVVGAAPSWSFEIEPNAATTPTGPVDVVLAFVTTPAQLRSHVDALAPRIRPAGALWIAWPRKAAGHVSEVTENLIREVVLPLGLVDVKVAAIDTDWSGLKIVWRKEER